MIASDIRSLYKCLFDFYSKQYWWPADTVDEVIIGAVLTQNTNWQNVVKAINNLKVHDLCTLEAIRVSEDDVIASLIKPSGYYNLKTLRLKNVCNAIINMPELTLPAFRDYLLSIKGVGEETADSILLYAFNKPTFVIDAYTVRLINRLCPDNTFNKYVDYQSFFQTNLPIEPALYNEYHALIVRHCVACCKKKPICTNCPIKQFCHY